MLGVAAEGGLQFARVERVQEGAQRVDGRGAAEAGAEGGVEPLAMHADEQADAAVGGGAGQDGQHREQQQVGEAVALPLAAARAGSLARRRAGRRTAPWRPPVRGTVGPQRPRRAADPSATPHLTNRSWPEPNSPGTRPPIDRGSAEEQGSGCRPSPSKEYRIKGGAGQCRARVQPTSSEASSLPGWTDCRGPGSIGWWSSDWVCHGSSTAWKSSWSPPPAPKKRSE